MRRGLGSSYLAFATVTAVLSSMVSSLGPVWPVVSFDGALRYALFQRTGGVGRQALKSSLLTSVLMSLLMLSRSSVNFETSISSSFCAMRCGLVGIVGSCIYGDRCSQVECAVRVEIEIDVRQAGQQALGVELRAQAAGDQFLGQVCVTGPCRRVFWRSGPPRPA